MKKLARVLNSVGRPADTYETPDGTRLLLLPHGGRVLGLFGPDDDENFYWTNPAFENVRAARAFFTRPGWPNSGGDRSWLAPEIDLFWPSYPALENYAPPPGLDPGAYRLETDTEGRPRLTGLLKVRLSRSQRRVALRITKAFCPAPNPLRNEPDVDLTGVIYAGYAQRATLAWAGDKNPGDARVGLWNLTQMPHGGELLVTTYSRAEPHLVFGSIPTRDLRVGEHLLRYHMRQRGEHKLSLRTAVLCGRAGYLLRAGRRWSLVIRNFQVDPSGDYADVLWNKPFWPGFAAQACNVNSDLGRFSEFEYHAPAIGTGRNTCSDTSQVWAFRGPGKAILAITHRLLTGPSFKP